MFRWLKTAFFEQFSGQIREIWRFPYFKKFRILTQIREKFPYLDSRLYKTNRKRLLFLSGWIQRTHMGNIIPCAFDSPMLMLLKSGKSCSIVELDRSSELSASMKGCRTSWRLKSHFNLIRIEHTHITGSLKDRIRGLSAGRHCWSFSVFRTYKSCFFDDWTLSVYMP